PGAVDLDRLMGLAGLLFGQTDGRDRGTREHGGRDVGAIDDHRVAVEHGLGDRPALVDRDRGQVDAVGDVTDRVDVGDGAPVALVDDDAAVGPRLHADV